MPDKQSFTQTIYRYLIALYLSLPNRSDEGRTLETSAFKFFTVASGGDSRIVKIIMARRTGYVSDVLAIIG